MSIRKTLLASFVAVLSMVSTAKATTVDLGTVHAGESGYLGQTTFGGLGIYNNIVTGVLPTNTLITFTYFFTGMSADVLASAGDYSYNAGGTHYFGASAASTAFGGINASAGFTNPVGHPLNISPSAPLVTTLASLSGGVGQTEIANISAGNVNFLSQLFGLMTNGASVALYYTVSSVPLPAAAQLFGLGLMALAAFSLAKRKQVIA